MPETPPAMPWAGPTATAGMAAGLPLRELLAILRRRRRVIAWVVVLVTGLATLIGLQADKTPTPRRRS